MRRPSRTSLVVCFGILAACDDAPKNAPSVDASSSTSPSRDTSVARGGPPDAAATAAPSASTIFVPLPGATASAAIDGRWPPAGFVSQKSKLAGFEVFASSDVSVSLKRHDVDNVTNRSAARFPACPSLASVRDRKGVEVMSRGGGEAEPNAGGNTPSWLVYRESARFGVIVVHAAAPRGDDGTDVACCLSGGDADASVARATLTNAEAKKALEACLAALTLSGDQRGER